MSHSDHHKSGLRLFFHQHDHDHSHPHDEMPGPGEYRLRELNRPERDYHQRAYTVGIGGPVGSGKTALLLALCRAMRKQFRLAVVTNDIYTREDAEFLLRNQALEPERIIGVETGGCPHTAIRDDVSSNMHALHELTDRFNHNIDLLFVESGGDNLAANFSRELADYTIYVIDVSGGDKIPRKGGPGVTQSDLLVINKIDLADMIGADLGVMERDASRMRGNGPFLFTRLKDGYGVPEIVNFITRARNEALKHSHKHSAA